MQNTCVKSGSERKIGDDSSTFQNVTVPYGKQIHQMGNKLRERGMIITGQRSKSNFKSSVKRNLMTSVPDSNISLQNPSDALHRRLGL
jgi:hypothetical protein